MEWKYDYFFKKAISALIILILFILYSFNCRYYICRPIMCIIYYVYHDKRQSRPSTSINYLSVITDRAQTKKK